MNNETGFEKKVLELEKANKNLEMACKQKTDFFISLAHETKTPLTLIRNYLDKYIKKAGMDEDIIIIKQNIDNLLRTIVHFLDAEKINRGQIYYNHDQATDISSLTTGIIPLFKELAAKKDVHIDADIQPGIHIRIDPFAANTIINNLIDNAIKYTHNNGRVTVQLYRFQGKIILKIIDTGIGISKEQQESLFQPLYEQQKRKQRIHGMGIGLFIVKHIIDSIDGDICVESKLNKGTTISITINKDRVTTGVKSIISHSLSEPFYSLN